MSASNWADCPNCEQVAKREHDKAIANWEASYGKVSPKEYADTKPPDSPRETEESLREDYELGIDKDLVFRMYYHASCEHCGFDFRKQIDEPCRCKPMPIGASVSTEENNDG